MDRLIKRYILKAQRDKDNDEINEGEFSRFSGYSLVWITELWNPIWCRFTHCPTGELKEIKQDISGLRFELLERASHDMETLAKLIKQLGDVGHVQQREEQKNEPAVLS